jgi:hypothetical protein
VGSLKILPNLYRFPGIDPDSFRALTSGLAESKAKPDHSFERGGSQ